MKDNSENIGKWIKFLDPENLKGNLMFSSLFIASFEAFKDYVVETVKYYYCTGFVDGQDIIRIEYETSVLSKDKSPVRATLFWLKENEAIEEMDIDLFQELIKYRNKLSHELMDLLFEGLADELPKKLSQLLQLRIKIERWWILNIEIPSSYDLDSAIEITEDDIMTSSQIFNQIVFDMLSGDEKKASYYKNEFLKKFKSNG